MIVKRLKKGFVEKYPFGIGKVFFCTKILKLYAMAEILMIRRVQLELEENVSPFQRRIR
jgi:hypothetical protein